MSKRSEVWNYFKRNDKNRDFAFCKQCNKQLECKGSSTTPLLNHLKLHKIYLNTSNLSTTTSSIEPIMGTPYIMEFFCPLLYCLKFSMQCLQTTCGAHALS